MPLHIDEKINMDDFLKYIQSRVFEQPGIGSKVYQCAMCKNYCIIISQVPINCIQRKCIVDRKAYGLIIFNQLDIKKGEK